MYITLRLGCRGTINTRESITLWLSCRGTIHRLSKSSLYSLVVEGQDTDSRRYHFTAYLIVETPDTGSREHHFMAWL